MSELPACVLFDLDGTLIDGFAGIAASVNHVRGLHRLPPLSVTEVTRHVGHGAEHLLRHTVDRGDSAANLTAYRDHHPSVLREGTRLLPGAREAIDLLHARGVLLGVCSNKPVAFTRELGELLGIAPRLNVILGPEDVRRHKPAPDMLLLAMARLGVSIQQTLYVGDMVVDVEAARAAGVRVWVVPTGSQSSAALAAAAPDRLLRGLTDLTALWQNSDI